MQNPIKYLRTLYIKWKLKFLLYIYRDQLDQDIVDYIKRIQDSGKVYDAEILQLDELHHKKYYLIFILYASLMILSQFATQYILAMLLPSIIIWQQYNSSSRKYYLAGVDKFLRSDSASIIGENDGDTVLLAWEKCETLELSFYYFNPISVLSVYAFVKEFPQWLYAIIFIINVFMMTIIRNLNMRAQSDRIVLNYELNSFYHNQFFHKMRVKILRKKAT